MAERQKRESTPAPPPTVTLTQVHNTNVTSGQTAPISPPPPFAVQGTVAYPDGFPLNRIWIQGQVSRELTDGTNIFFTDVSNTGGVVTKSFTFNLVGPDVMMDGQFTLTVNMSNAVLDPVNLTFNGGVGADDAQIEASGFVPMPPGGPSPTPPPPPAPLPVL